MPLIALRSSLVAAAVSLIALRSGVGFAAGSLIALCSAAWDRGAVRDLRGVRVSQSATSIDHLALDEIGCARVCWGAEELLALGHLD